LDADQLEVCSFWNSHFNIIQLFYHYGFQFITLEILYGTICLYRFTRSSSANLTKFPQILIIGIYWTFW
jgi:hypothetical protein